MLSSSPLSSRPPLLRPILIPVRRPLFLPELPPVAHDARAAQVFLLAGDGREDGRGGGEGVAVLAFRGGGHRGFCMGSRVVDGVGKDTGVWVWEGGFKGAGGERGVNGSIKHA